MGIISKSLGPSPPFTYLIEEMRLRQGVVAVLPQAIES
jgi:hypothetical protein